MIRESVWMTKFIFRSLREEITSWRRGIDEWYRFWKSYKQYKEMSPPSGQPELATLYPCLGENTAKTVVEPIYFYQDNWAFQKIVENRPSLHVDIGSHHKFVALLSNVVPVLMVDLRPLSLTLEKLQFKKGSIVDLPFRTASIDSISSLCVVEHIGLGRYGDTLDPFGSDKAVSELKRVLAPGGHLYVSVPVGNKNLVAFNAGRIFSLAYFLEVMRPLTLMEQSFIVGETLQKDYTPSPLFGTTGLFLFTKT